VKLLVYIYIPERESTDPPNIADALSESLSNQYGVWFNPTSSCEPPRLSGMAICRNTAIQSESWLQFDFNIPINIVNFELLHFGIAVQKFSGSEPGKSGGASIILIDSSGTRMARTDFPITIDGNYSIKQFLATDFYSDSGFNWASVKSILFMLNYELERGTWLWIDEGPFFRFNVVLGTLYIGAVDESNNPISGKSMYLTNPYGFGNTYTLPFGPQGVNPAGNWIVTILDTQNFLHWQDGATENPRTFSIDYGQNISATAIFKTTTPPPPPPTNYFLAGLGLVSIISLIAYIYLKG